MSRTLIGAIGYHNLRNHSIGPLLLPRLQALRWPPGVRVEELNWGPIAVVQRLQAEIDPFERIVILTARPTERPAGEIALWRWGGELPHPDEVQARVAEAVTGIISADNLLIVGEHFKVWPDEVFIVDVAPGAQETGPSLTPSLRAVVPEIIETVRQVALRGAAAGGFQWLRGSDLGVGEAARKWFAPQVDSF